MVSLPCEQIFKLKRKTFFLGAISFILQCVYILGATTFTFIRNFLVDAVYSDDLTTHGDSVMRVPYFTHIQRRQNQQSQKMDEMEDQLETVKKRYSPTLTLCRFCLLGHCQL